MRNRYLALAAYGTIIICTFIPAAANALTKSQTDRFLQAANKGCTVTTDPAVIGHVQGTDKEVYIVRYGVESCGGGNNHAMPIAVLYDAGGGRVAAFENRVKMGDAEKVVINASHAIVVSTAEYAANDPRCCPSKKGVFALAVHGNALGLPD